jgi:hypothetical protein
MFGFVNSNKENRKLGGEIYQEKQRAQKIVWGIVGIIVFVIFNIFLYFLTKV